MPFFLFVRARVIVRCFYSDLCTTKKISASRRFPMGFFNQGWSRRPYSNRIHDLRMEIHFFRFKYVLRMVNRLMRLMTCNRMTSRRVVTSQLLECFRPRIRGLIIICQMGSLFLSMFRFVPRPYILINVLARGIFYVRR